MTDTLSLRHDGSLRMLLLNRRDHRNALTRQMIIGLADQCEQVSADPEARLLVLGAVGVDFCTGLDLDEFYASANASEEEARADTGQLARLLGAVDRCPLPTVALVQGRAYGIGATLALSCDVVLASTTSTIAWPEASYGFLPAFAAARLNGLVGRQAAFEILATGRTLSAEEGRTLGLVSRVIPEEGFHAVTGSCLKALGRTAEVLLELKRLFREMAGQPFGQALPVCAEASLRARQSTVFRDAAEQFLDMS